MSALERKGTALRDLTQALEFSQHPATNGNSVARGWPPYLEALASIALLLEEASKLRLGQGMIAYTPTRDLKP